MEWEKLQLKSMDAFNIANFDSMGDPVTISEKIQKDLIST